MSVPAASEPMPALALLAGGRATRLRPLTEGLAKSMVEVAGAPFIAHQLRLAVREGISDIVICCGHLGDQIEAFVGDGSAFGCQVRYSPDGVRALGTGGALRQALPLLGDNFLVIYGDSYLDTPYRPVWEAFQRSGRPGLMTVMRNDGRWDASNVEFADGAIRRYDKVHRTPAMRHIDYGLGALAAAALRDRQAGAAFDLAEVYRDLLGHGQLAGYEVGERFYEIGSPAGLAETRAFLGRARRRANPD
jgi:MurNAc alpha-1-phosphate uridylyltransferase